MSSKPLIIAVGELLWDILPDDKYLGGAPANFIYHASQLGARAVLISRVGNDELGSHALNRCAELGIDTSHIQIDPNHKTGVVDVEFYADGEHDFTIVENAAWDYIAVTPNISSLARGADMIYFGSLAQRSKQSRQTIYRILNSVSDKTVKLFDVNLRADFYSEKIIRTGFEIADIVKLNEQELEVLLPILTPADCDDVYTVNDVIEKYNLSMICITMGNRGCELKTPYETAIHRGFEIDMKDTIGAGDAFTAALATNFLSGKSLEKIAYRANLLGSYVASQKGATPHISQKILEQII